MCSKLKGNWYHHSPLGFTLSVAKYQRLFCAENKLSSCQVDRWIVPIVSDILLRRNIMELSLRPSSFSLIKF